MLLSELLYYSFSFLCIFGPICNIVIYFLLVLKFCNCNMCFVSKWVLKKEKQQQQKNRLIRFLVGSYLQKSIISGSIRGTAIVLICCNCKAFTKMSSLVVETSPVSWAWPYLQLYDHHANFNRKNTVCLPCLPINSMLYRTKHVWLFTAKFYGMNNILLVRLKSSTLQKFSQLNSRIWSSDLECFFYIRTDFSLSYLGIYVLLEALRICFSFNFWPHSIIAV